MLLNNPYVSRPLDPMFFFFNDPATTEIYTLSLHDALPISRPRQPPAAPSPAIGRAARRPPADRKSTRLNSSHVSISYAVFCLKKKKNNSSALFPLIKKTEAHNTQ